MAVTNTGIVERVITGVNESDFLNPLGDEEVSNRDFSDGSTDWQIGSWSISGGLIASGNTSSLLRQDNVYTSTEVVYRTAFEAKSVNGSPVTLRVYDGSGNNFETITITSSDFEYFELTRQRQGATPSLFFYNNSNAEIEIKNISVKEILVNRESIATNTGVIERGVTGVNESDLFINNVVSQVVNLSLLYNSNIADVGDSLLDQNGTQPILIAKYNIASNQSLSVSGKKIVSGDSGSVVNQIQNITNSPKLILIGGGTNDFGNSSPIGALSSTDTTEYCGAISFILDYATTNYPDATIIKLGLPFGDWQTAGSFAIGQTNSLGLTRSDYMLAEKQLCEDRGITYVNQLEELGWNTSNILDKTSDRIHPNAEGSQDRAELFSVYIDRVFPAISERPITGVNESDPMFPNNTISNIINLADNLLVALFNAFKTRVLADGGIVDNEVGLDIESFDDSTNLTMLPNAYKDGVLYTIIPEDTSGDFSVVRGSGATRVNSGGLVETVSSNAPRIDYSDGTPVLLTEPQSTNLITYSEDFSQWNKGSDLSLLNGFLAPDGNSTAYKVTKTGVSQPYLTFNAGLVQTTTRSVYARTISGTGTATLLSHNANTNNLFTLTEEWQRFEVSDTDSSSGRSSFYLADFRGSGTLTEYLVWGANATNDQGYATSYIPTSGAIATRLADSVTGAGDATTFNSTEGVLYAEVSGIENDGTFKVISLSDGTTSNVVRFYKNTTDNQLSIRVTSSGVNYFNQIFTLTNSNATNKLALKYKENDFAFWVNGVEVNADAGGLTPIGLNVLSLSEGNGLSPFYGKTKDLRVYNTALTDLELQELTTI